MIMQGSSRVPGRRTTVAGLLLAVVLAFPPALEAAAGRFVFVHGPVYVAGRDAPPRRAVAGSPVEAGQVVNTHAGARAQMRFADGTVISLGGSTSFYVDAYASGGDDERGVFSLIRGGLRFVTGAIARKSRHAFRLESPLATIGIRGTDCFTWLDGGGQVAGCNVDPANPADEGADLITPLGTFPLLPGGPLGIVREGEAPRELDIKAALDLLAEAGEAADRASSRPARRRNLLRIEDLADLIEDPDRGFELPKLLQRSGDVAGFVLASGSPLQDALHGYRYVTAGPLGDGFTLVVLGPDAPSGPTREGWRWTRWPPAIADAPWVQVPQAVGPLIERDDAATTEALGGDFVVYQPLIQDPASFRVGEGLFLFTPGGDVNVAGAAAGVTALPGGADIGLFDVPDHLIVRDISMFRSGDEAVLLYAGDDESPAPPAEPYLGLTLARGGRLSDRWRLYGGATTSDSHQDFVHGRPWGFAAGDLTDTDGMRPAFNLASGFTAGPAAIGSGFAFGAHVLAGGQFSETFQNGGLGGAGPNDGFSIKVIDLRGDPFAGERLAIETFSSSRAPVCGAVCSFDSLGALPAISESTVGVVLNRFNANWVLEVGGVPRVVNGPIDLAYAAEITPRANLPGTGIGLYGGLLAQLAPFHNRAGTGRWDRLAFTVDFGLARITAADVAGSFGPGQTFALGFDTLFPASGIITPEGTAQPFLRGTMSPALGGADTTAFGHAPLFFNGPDGGALTVIFSIQNANATSTNSITGGAVLGR